MSTLSNLLLLNWAQFNQATRDRAAKSKKENKMNKNQNPTSLKVRKGINPNHNETALKVRKLAIGVNHNETVLRIK